MVARCAWTAGRSGDYVACQHLYTERAHNIRVCVECGEETERLKGIEYCRKCDHEYEYGGKCLCDRYYKHMESGFDFLVPQWWIRENWHGPL